MSAILSPGVKWSQFPDAGTIVSGDTLVGIRGGVNVRFDASTLLSPTSLVLPVTQAAHGFVAGNIVKFNGLIYVLAQANTAANANVFGIVSGVVDANHFDLTLSGMVVTLTGLIAGSVYYLNPTVAGAMTVTAPVTPGQIYKPVLIANSTTSGVWLNYQGNQL